MLIRLVISSLLAAIVWMAWGTCFWMFTPFPEQMMDRIADEDAAIAALKPSLPESGNYFYPFADKEAMNPDSEASKVMMEKHRKGPLVQIIYRKDGLDPMSPQVYALGFVHLFVGSLLIGLVLVLASSGLSGYPARLLVATLVALFGPVAITLADPIWYHHPWKFSLYSAGFQLVGWFLAAIVLAAVIRPRQA